MDNTGVAKVEGGGVMSAAEARRIACDSTVMRLVLGAGKEILDVGRQQRTAPKAIRKALIERDGTCAFPGCQTEPAQCHAHHVVEWANGGPTSLDNMVLLCGSHHRLIHHSRWTVKMVDRGRCSPTAWKKRRNGPRRVITTTPEITPTGAAHWRTEPERTRDADRCHVPTPGTSAGDGEKAPAEDWHRRRSGPGNLVAGRAGLV